MGCKHGWRQYYDTRRTLDGMYLSPKGYFCIYCLARKIITEVEKSSVPEAKRNLPMR